MDDLRIGVVGLGNMGSVHAAVLNDGKVPGAILTAVCDINPSKQAWTDDSLDTQVAFFSDAQTMFGSGKVDAVVIATPHYDHPPLAIAAFKQDLHVLIEKPAGVYTKQVREMNEVAAKSDQVFAIMFQVRQQGAYRKLRELIQEGHVGELRRVNWTATSWFRTQFYYNSGGWRATWAGEGGGILMNQCPHNLDMWQWLFGMPERVRASCYYGKHHDIEVEDEVFAQMEYANGAIGTFIVSTGETPGWNRLEVFGNNGCVLLENGRLRFQRTVRPVDEHIAQWPAEFDKPEVWDCDIEVRSHSRDEGHVSVMKELVSAIRERAQLTAPGAEGINGLMLANAMLLSSWLGEKWNELPVDEDLYCEKLQEHIAKSTYVKPELVRSTGVDFDKSRNL